MREWPGVEPATSRSLVITTITAPRLDVCAIYSVIAGTFHFCLIFLPITSVGARLPSPLRLSYTVFLFYLVLIAALYTRLMSVLAAVDFRNNAAVCIS